MKEQVIVVRRDGSQITLRAWQSEYGLEVGSTAIGKYFSAAEGYFSSDVGRYGQIIVNELLIRIMDRYREKKKKAVRVNAFNRDDAKQQELKEQGFRTATFSPHVVKMAVDVDTLGINDLRQFDAVSSDAELLNQCKHINREQADLVRIAAAELKISVRVGNEQYLREGQTFIHIDVCPEYYAPGKPFHNQPHPPQWENPISW